MPANKHWNNFGYENYKFNKKVFNNYCDRDALIWPKCKLFLSMPKSVVSASSCSTPSKKRTRDGFEVDTPEGVVEKSPVKTICLVTSSSEEESENGAVIEAGGGEVEEDEAENKAGGGEVEEDDAEKQTGRAMAQARTGRMRLRLPDDSDVVASDSESEGGKEDDAEKETGGGEGGKDDDAGDAGE